MYCSPGYVSTSKVLLQGTRSPNELPGEMQIATSLVVLNHVADDLNWGVTGNDLQRQVSAVIADGNVLVVSGAAATPQAAVRRPRVRPRPRPRLVLADHPTDKFRPVTPGTSANHVEVT